MSFSLRFLVEIIDFQRVNDVFLTETVCFQRFLTSFCNSTLFSTLSTRELSQKRCFLTFFIFQTYQTISNTGSHDFY